MAILRQTSLSFFPQLVNHLNYESLGDVAQWTRVCLAYIRQNIMANILKRKKGGRKVGKKGVMEERRKEKRKEEICL